MWLNNLFILVNVFEMKFCIFLCNGFILIFCLEIDFYVESSEKFKLSEYIDEKIEREIEKIFGKYRRKESVYSI